MAFFPYSCIKFSLARRGIQIVRYMDRLITLLLYAGSPIEGHSEVSTTSMMCALRSVATLTCEKNLEQPGQILTKQGYQRVSIISVTSFYSTSFSTLFEIPSMSAIHAHGTKQVVAFSSSQRSNAPRMLSSAHFMKAPRHQLSSECKFVLTFRRIPQIGFCPPLWSSIQLVLLSLRRCKQVYRHYECS